MIGAACSPATNTSTTTPSTIETVPPSPVEATTTIVETVREAPDSSQTVTPVAPTEIVPLRARAQDFNTRLSDGFDVASWLPATCRQSLGLVSGDDPLLPILLEEIPEPARFHRTGHIFRIHWHLPVVQSTLQARPSDRVRLLSSFVLVAR